MKYRSIKEFYDDKGLVPCAICEATLLRARAVLHYDAHLKYGATLPETWADEFDPQYSAFEDLRATDRVSTTDTDSIL